MIQRRNITKTTGTKLTRLEKLDTVNKFLTAVLNGKTEAWQDDEALGFIELYKELVLKINDCIAPISKAYYSSIMVYKNGGGLCIHSGANIDPEKKEQLKEPIHRNCAEKQAALSASWHDQLSNRNLKILFLFRKSFTNQKFSAEKLIPCKDCSRNYVEDLLKNNGKLVVILEDDQPRDFLTKSFDRADSINQIKTLEVSKSHNMNYVIIDAEAMKFLKVESELGARVCSLDEEPVGGEVQ